MSKFHRRLRNDWYEQHLKLVAQRGHRCDICATWNDRDRQLHGVLAAEYRDAGKAMSEPDSAWNRRGGKRRAKGFTEVGHDLWRLKETYAALVTFERDRARRYAAREEP